MSMNEPGDAHAIVHNRNYVFQEFPVLLYHKNGETRVAKSKEEEESLAPEWSRVPSPAYLKKAQVPDDYPIKKAK
jgi:hypothetical protein